MIAKDNGLSYDIVVAGLGTAGSVALITAAKQGLKVLGIEALNAMGGTGTLGGIANYYFGSRGGIYEEINAETRALQDAFHSNNTLINCDAKAYVLESCARRLGADIMLDTRVTGVIKDGNRVTGLKCLRNGEYIEIKSRFVIDCTGDAEVCVMAGCRTRTGRALDGQTQPFSNVAFVYSNNNVYTMSPDVGYVRQTDCEDLSRKIMESLAFAEVLRKNYGQKHKFITNAAIMGIREGAVIIGEENITLEGFFRNPKVEKPLFYAFSNVDSHSKDTAFEDEALLDWYIVAGMWSVCFSVGVPLGALIPKEYDGILAAGRCIAVDHNMAALIRMKRDMEKSGEAAAQIACLAIKDGVRAVDVDYGKLSRTLKETKCLNEENNVGYIRWTSGKKVRWLDNTADIIEGLSGDEPGIAIWSAKLMGECIKPALIKCLEDKTNGLLRKNAAFALGIMGDESCIPVLMEIAEKRDVYVPKSGVKYNYAHAVTAIYLLGKLAARESAGILLDIVRTKGVFDADSFKYDELHMKEADVSFQLISNSIVALARIAKRCPELRESIKREIENSLNNGFKISISLKANRHIEYDMAGLLKTYTEKTL